MLQYLYIKLSPPPINVCILDVPPERCLQAAEIGVTMCLPRKRSVPIPRHCEHRGNLQDVYPINPDGMPAHKSCHAVEPG